MAKNAEDDDDKFDKMDQESLDFLEQVRKGKSRNFVLSVKGGKVKSLLVKKKRVKDKEMKEARGGGFQPMFGVVSGQGGNITFTIAKSDGFEKDPMGGKVQKLKSFLKDQTGKAFKPTVELVSTPPPIPFEEDDLNHPLIARFAKLSGLIEQVCQQHPNSSDQTREMANSVHLLLSDDETIDQTGPQIDELEKYLGGFNVTTAPAAENASAPTDTSTAPAADRSVLAGKLAEGLKKLKPAVQAAILAAPAKKDVLIQSMGQVVTDIKSENLDDAKVNMVALGKLIQEIKAGAADGPETENASSGNDSEPNPGLASKLAGALKKLKPAADSLIKQNADLKSELYAGIASIAGEIKSQRFEEAAQSVKAFAAKLKAVGEGLKQSAAAGPDENADSQTPSESPVVIEPGQADPETASTPTESDDSQSVEEGSDSKFAQRSKQLEPMLLKAQKADRENATRLGGIWDYANEVAGTGDYLKALEQLDRLEKAVMETLESSNVDEDKPSSVSPEMAFKQSRLKWAFAKDKVNQELRAFRESVLTVANDEESEVHLYLAQELDLKTKEIYENLMDSARRLQELLDTNVEAQSELEKQVALKNTQDELDVYENYVTTDPDVQNLDASPFGNVQVQATLVGAIQELRGHLVT